MDSLEGEDMKLCYEQLKAGSFVTAAAVGYFTSASSPQLVVCKQISLQVWEIEGETQSMMVNSVFAWPIIFCSIIPAPASIREPDLSSPQKTTCSHTLDLLLVGDGQGNIAILKWDVKTNEIKEIAPSEVFGSNMISSTMIMTKTILSVPLTLLNDLENRQQLKEIGTSLIAISSFMEIIQVVSVSWKYSVFTKNTNFHCPSEVIRNPEVSTRWKMYYLQMEIEGSPLSGVFPSFKAPNILALSFLGSSAIQDGVRAQKAVDGKGRPLLAILLAHREVNQNMLSLECFAMDLGDGKLLQGPWKISNLHPTTALLIPWIYEDGLAMVSNEEKGVYLQVGVMTISSMGISCFNANGDSRSLCLSLKGLPTCYDICNKSTLVVADSGSSLYIIDLRVWCKFRVQKILSNNPLSTAQIVKFISAGEVLSCQNPILFVYGEGGDAHILQLPCQTEYYTEKIHVIGSSCSLGTILKAECGTYLPLLKEDIVAKEILPDNSVMLDSLAPVHDSVLIPDDGCSSDFQLLLTSGNAPNGRFSRMMLGFRLIIDECHDIPIDDLPNILPIYESPDYLNCGWAVMAHRLQDKSELMEFTESGIHYLSFGRFDTNHRTIAVGCLPGRWIVQITPIAIRVLDSNGHLVHEWLPPDHDVNAVKLMPSATIKMAALNEDGVVLAATNMLYSVIVDGDGTCHVAGTRSQHYEVSSAGIFRAKLSDFATMEKVTKNADTNSVSVLKIVIIGQWMSNTVSILSWPSLNDLAEVECGSECLVRSIAIAELDGLQYLFLGSSDGLLIYFMLTITEYRKSNLDGIFQEDFGIPLDSMNHERISDACNSFTDVVGKGKYTIIVSDNHSLRIGQSEVSLNVGRFFGHAEVISGASISALSSSVLAQTSESCVILFKNGTEIQAANVQGAGNALTSIARFHRENCPYSFIAVSRSGQLLISHLDFSFELCMDKMYLNGTPLHLAYHQQSKCAIVCCQGQRFPQILFIQIKSMQKVLTVDIGDDCFITMLKSIILPCDKHRNQVECLLIGSRKNSGLLSFFRYGSCSPGRQQIQFELNLITRHEIDSLCLCYCIFHGNSSLGQNSKSVSRYAKMIYDSVKNEMKPLCLSGTTWTLFLAIGGFGKVDLLVLDLENDEKHDISKWALHTEKAIEFGSLGKSYVTALVAISSNTLLVIEELYGASIFEMKDSRVMVPIALHLFDNPIQAVVPLSEDVFLFAIHGEGMKLMRRNLDEEVSYQVEKAKIEEMLLKSREESGQVSSQDQAYSTENTELAIRMELPCFLQSSILRLPLSVSHLISGKLGIRTDHSLTFQDDVVIVTSFCEIGNLSWHHK